MVLWPHWASNRASFFNWPWNQNQAAVWPGSVSPAICIGWLKYLKNIWKEFPQICQHPRPGRLAGVYGMTRAPNLFRSTDTGQHRPGHRVPVDRGDIGSGLNGGEITEIQVLMVIGEATDHLLHTSSIYISGLNIGGWWCWWSISCSRLRPYLPRYQDIRISTRVWLRFVAVLAVLGWRTAEQSRV